MSIKTQILNEQTETWALIRGGTVPHTREVPSCSSPDSATSASINKNKKDIIKSEFECRSQVHSDNMYQYRQSQEMVLGVERYCCYGDQGAGKGSGLIPLDRSSSGQECREPSTEQNTQSAPSALLWNPVIFTYNPPFMFPLSMPVDTNQSDTLSDMKAEYSVIDQSNTLSFSWLLPLK